MDKDPQTTLARKREYNRLITDRVISDKEIPEHDFVFMTNFMLPGDKTKDYILATESQEGLDNAHELIPKFIADNNIIIGSYEDTMDVILKMMQQIIIL